MGNISTSKYYDLVLVESIIGQAHNVRADFHLPSEAQSAEGRVNMTNLDAGRMIGAVIFSM